MTLAAYLGRNLTPDNELKRTAEMLVEIAEEQGVYFAVAFLYDAGYNLKRISKLLPILEAQKGAMKIEAKHD